MIELWITLGGLFVGLVSILLYGRNERRAGRQDTRDEANAETIKRRKAGQEAVRDGRDSGLSPDERLRRAVDDLTD